MRVAPDDHTLRHKVERTRNPKELGVKVFLERKEPSSVPLEDPVLTPCGSKSVRGLKAHNLAKQFTVSNTSWTRWTRLDESRIDTLHVHMHMHAL